MTNSYVKTPTMRYTAIPNGSLIITPHKEKRQMYINLLFIYDTSQQAGDGKDNSNTNNQQRVKYNEWKFRVYCEIIILFQCQKYTLTFNTSTFNVHWNSFRR